MPKSHNECTTELCHNTLFRAPVLFLAHLKSFFSESHSPYARYGSFAILKNNFPTALKCIIVGVFNSVHNLCIDGDKLAVLCVQTAHNLEFMRRAKTSTQTCTHIMRRLYQLVITRIITELTSLKDHLSPLSTQPIITIYLNKRVKELVCA